MSQLTDAAEGFKEALLRQDAQAQGRIVAAYNDAYGALQRDVERVGRKIAAARAAGQEPTQAWLYRVGRITDLQEQAARRMAAFGTETADLIRRTQASFVEHAGADAEHLVRLQLPPAGAVVSFNTLPHETLTQLVGNLSDGSPLMDLFGQYGPAAANRLRSTLTTGVAVGWHPNRIARAFRDQMDGDLVRARVVARTETLRAYREATRQTYLANEDVVDGWVWLATPTSRTCAMCWAMSGTHHPNTETLDGHPNCRCAMVPDVKSPRELGLGQSDHSMADDIPKGEDQFRRLSAAEQEHVLGPRGYDLYTEGKVTLQDFVGRKENHVWGSMRFTNSARTALRQAEGRVAMEALGGHRPPTPVAPPSAPAPPLPTTVLPPVVDTEPLTFKGLPRMEEEEKCYDWAIEHFARWAEGLTDDEIIAIQQYQAGTYADDLNFAMRRGEELTGTERSIHDHLIRLLDGKGNQLPEAINAYRGVKSGPIVDALKRGEDIVGMEVTEPAFQSTSMSYSTAKTYGGYKGHVIEFVLPEGESVIPVDAVNRQGQNEIILRPGKTMKVVEVVEETNSTTIRVALVD